MDASVPKRTVFRRRRPTNKFRGGERSLVMFREIAENAVSKAKEDISVPQGVLVLIAVASFVTGLVIGIICASGAKSSKIKKSSFKAENRAGDFNFDDDDDDEGYEYSF